MHNTELVIAMGKMIENLKILSGVPNLNNVQNASTGSKELKDAAL